MTEEQNPDDYISREHFIQCESCSLFIIADHSHYIWLKGHHPGKEPGSICYTCQTCKEKTSLLMQIDDLNKTIFDMNNTIDGLNSRIRSLIMIQTLEDDVNNSINQLSNQFSSCSISNESFIIPEAVTEEVIPAECTLNKSTANTSIWTDLDASKSKSSDFIVIGDETMNTPDVSDTNATDHTNVSIEETETSPTENFTQNPSVTLTPQFDQTEVLLVGDKTFFNVNIGEYRRHDNKIVKITHRNAKVRQTEGNLKYLVEKLHKNTKTIIAHVGANNVKEKSSINTQSEYKSLYKTTNALGTKLVLSGPLPPVKCSSEMFSRLLALNNWLLQWTTEEDIVFVDNFDLFWRKPHLFKYNGIDLNNLGSLTLSNHIRSCVKHII